MAASAGPAPSPAVSPAAAPPAIDVVRVDAAGRAIVAGRAPAGGEVVLRVDGAEVATAAPDGSGTFVSFLDIAVADAPRLLTVETRDAGGRVARAQEDVILAPGSPPSASGGAVTIASNASGPAPASVGASGDATRIDVRPTLPGLAAEMSGPPAPTRDARAAPTPPDRIAPAAPAAAAAGPPAPDLIGRPAAPRAASAETDQTRVAAAPSASAPMAAFGAAPRVFRSGPDGVRLADSGPPAVAGTLGVDAIAYDAAGAVTISGRGAPDEALRVYLDDAPVTDVRVGPDGAWTMPLPDVRTGVYTLRVDAVADDGSVTARVETPFQRTAPEVAAAARRAGVTAITVQPGYTLWAISRGWFGEGLRYVQIFEANRDQIRNPDLIYPGQVFALPPDAAAPL